MSEPCCKPVLPMAPPPCRCQCNRDRKEPGDPSQAQSQGEAGAPGGDAPVTATKAWNIRYFVALALVAVLWWLAWSTILPASDWLVYDAFGLARESLAASALAFFLYDTVKILLLLVAMIYGIAWLRASLDTGQIRTRLAGKRRVLGYFLGATFGAVTPFCSCSSIPLFLGFSTAGIPIGISMAFLITSPIINEIAVVLLWGLLGWKFTVLYVTVGMAAGIIGGFVMDFLRADRWLQPFIRNAVQCTPAGRGADGAGRRLSIHARHAFALDETISIVRRVWIWVLAGVGLGAALHGFVPDNWFAENFGAGEWWSVPAAVLAGIPLYSNVTGIVPVMESLIVKGLPIGTTMAFCMAAVAASIPEVMLLRQIMTIRLQATFIAYLWVIFTLVGWCFNLLGPYIL